VIGIVGGTVTAAASNTGHWISFATTGAMMLGLCIYVWYHGRTRWGTHWQKWGPTYLCILSSILVMMDLSRHVLQDLNWWPDNMSNGWGSAEYQSNCGSETMSCLSKVGWLFTIVATYTGFVLLAVATLWNANICDRLKDIRAEWRRIRNNEARPETEP